MFNDKVCVLLDDPCTNFVLTGWDQNSKLYTLKNSAGRIATVSHDKFVPIDDLCADFLTATPDGRIEIIQALPDTILPPHILARPSLASQPASRPHLRTRPAPCHGDTAPAFSDPSADPVKARVRALLPAGLERADIADASATFLNISPADLLTKYAHLDNGRFRMVIGNRLTATFKKEK
jgi:hypothetical protein